MSIFKKTFMKKLNIIFLSLIPLTPVSTHASEPAWDGWYGGVNQSYKSNSTSTNYSHKHIGGCTNLNFGAEWPGDLCEGNQDFSFDGNANTFSASTGLFVERLWSADKRVYGWSIGIVDNVEHLSAERMVLSKTWGDTLNVNIRLREAVNLKAIIGFPNEEWLPFLSMGVVLKRADINFQQDQYGYDLPVIRSKEQWVSGLEFGAGVKKHLDSDWVATVEFYYQKLNPFDLVSDGVTPGYGLRYPDTTIRVNSEANVLRLGIAKKF